MNVVVDTSVWSLALRRTGPMNDPRVFELVELIREGRVVVIGPIRQELLSGVRSQEQFARLRDEFKAFPDLALDAADYEAAAQWFNACRERGVQGSNTDFLICAVAKRRDLAILTADGDFARFDQVLSLRLHSPR